MTLAFVLFGTGRHMAILTKWLPRAFVALVAVMLLSLFVWQRMSAGSVIGQVADQYEQAGIDTSECRSLTRSPYVTGDARCLERPMGEIARKIERGRGRGHDRGAEEESRHEEPPLD